MHLTETSDLSILHSHQTGINSQVANSSLYEWELAYQMETI